VLAAAISLMIVSVAPAGATEGSQYSSYGQYGEVTRFGGFDSTWFDEGKYDGKGGASTESEPAAGLFVDPVGFTVDPDDDGSGTTAVYVLDSVSGLASASGPQGTEWRLQKLSAVGEPLANTEFYLPKDESFEEATYGIFAGVVGLAVDDSTGRIYTVLYDSTGAEAGTTRQAQEVLDWSTTPDAGKLVAPTGATLDKVSTPVSGYTGPGVASTEAQLQSGSAALYEPQGLAVDDSAGQDAVAIAADSKARNSSGKPQGPAVVEQVSTTSGQETAGFTVSSLKGVTNASTEDETALAAGISTDAGGELNVLLSTTAGANASLLDDLRLSAGLASPTVLASKTVDPIVSAGGHNYPGAAQPDNAAPTVVANATGKISSGGGKGAAAQVVALSNGLYASDFLSEPIGHNGYWAGAANEGVRLLQPETASLLTNANAPVTSVFGTLGNATAAGACAIGDGAVSHGYNGVVLAAGADGSVWVLTSGKDSAEYEPGSGSDAAYVTGRQVIELAPGASKACPGPAGTFSVTKEGGTPQPASSTLTVPVGSTVDFNAASIEYPASNGGKPAGIYAYEWDPELGASGDPGYTLIDDAVQPTEFHPEQTGGSYTYTSPGIYKIGLKLLGDFGEYDETGTIVVQTSSPPTASFSAPSEAQTGQAVSFNASASQPAGGASIANYEWKFGDGASDETQSASDTHTYSSAGTYTVTLTVRDNDNQQSSPVTKQVTVKAPSTNTTNTTSTQTTSTTSTTTQSTTSTSKPATKKPLTTAQKLAAALKLCKKDKSKKKRTACEKAAKKKYAVKKPAKKKSKAKK
jgi:PKD repeat protein